MRRLLQGIDLGARGLFSRVRNLRFRALGVKLGGYCWLQRVNVPQQWEDITLEVGVSLDDGVTLLCSGPRRRDKLILRARTYVNRHTIFDAHESIEVGEDVMIGPYCFFTDSDHGSALGPLIREQPMESAPVRIGAGTWFGAGVVVLKGVTIGRGAIIGAGSVVTQDVGDYQIAVGSPARCIRKRR